MMVPKEEHFNIEAVLNREWGTLAETATRDPTFPDYSSVVVRATGTRKLLIVQ